MDWTQMRERCPSTKFVSVAVLPKHQLQFTRKSKNRGCGVADVVPHDTALVWGTVFEIPESEIGLLDRSEGFQPGRAKNSYVRSERHVLRDGDEKYPLLVSVYFGVREENPPLPNEAYKALIINGAEFWKLPAAYVNWLKEIKTA